MYIVDEVDSHAKQESLNGKERHPSKDLFTDYLIGGSILPQRRAGINIAMIPSILSPQLQPVDWITFAEQTLSQNQAQKSWSTMEGQHRVAGVTIPKIDDPVLRYELMNREWQKALGAIIKSIIIKGYPGEELPEKVIELLNDEWLRLLMQFYTDPNNNDKLRTMHDMAAVAKTTLTSDLSDLTRFFRYSLFGDEPRASKYKSEAGNISSVQSKYGIRGDLLSHPQQCTQACEAILAEALENRLKNEFPNEDTSWITWGIKK